MFVGSQGRKLAWLALVLLILIALFFVFTPAWIIQPFKPQSEKGVAVSYLLKAWSPLVTLAASLAALALVIFLWRASRRWWRRVVLILLLLPMLVATWFARQNHFEWMFNPLPNPNYAKVNEEVFVSDSDVVMAVETGGEAVAYPIRLLAYHHVVEDVVGGVPIAATY